MSSAYDESRTIALFNFGNSEITSGVDRVEHTQDIAGQIDACFHANDGTGLFASKNGRAEILTASYRLGLSLSESGDEAIMEVLSHEYFLGRKRKPKGKPFLVAVQLAAKPNDDPQHKLASEYAAILEHAHNEGVAPETVVDFFDKKAKYLHLKDARLARQETKRRAAEEARLSEPEIRIDTLEVSVSSGVREALLSMKAGDKVQGKIKCLGPLANGWQQFKFISTGPVLLARK